MPNKGNELVDQLIDYIVAEKNYTLLTYIQQKIDGIVNSSTALVRSATKIDSESQEKLERTIRDRFSEVSNIRFEIDDTLIGGIQVTFRDYRYDGSVKGTLDQLRSQLK